MKRIPRILCYVIVVLTLSTIVIGIGGRLYLATLLSNIEGTIRVSGVSEPAKIIRDNWGVPHIIAENGPDAYFALGFTQAQDRLFQMELQRRVAKGELAEIFGPDLINMDKMFRTLLFRHRAESYLREIDKINPEVLRLLDSFLDGINHFIETGPLPIEFKLLGFTPRSFTRIDSLASIGYMAFSLASGLKNDSLQTILSSYLTLEDLEILFPEYTRYNKHTIMVPEGIEHETTNEYAQDIPSWHGGAEVEKIYGSLLEILRQSSDIVPSFTGSNSWILASSRSFKGHALLANDPHISISLPGTWYEAHVRYPGYENYGYHLPLLPFPMLAHNDQKAWAITMLKNDDMDLYMETYNPDNPDQVMYKGEWIQTAILQETIAVKDGQEEDLVIRITPHGPIITDFLQGYSGKPVSLSWVYHKEENPILDIVWGMGAASDMEQFEKAISKLTSPGLNISYIDHTGNIAWWAAGRFPIRPAHMSGKEIYDGSTGEYDIKEYLSFEKNPSLKNPENGLIITANNLPTHEPIEAAGKITGYFRPSDRAARIYELLSTQEKWSIEELKNIQVDTELKEGKKIAEKFLLELESAQEEFTAKEKKALVKLQAWDGNMELTSIGGAIFQFTLYNVAKELLEPHIGADNLRAYLNLVISWSFLKGFAEGDQPLLSGKNHSDTVKSRKDVILTAFKNSVAEMTAKFGENQEEWQWGDIHTIEFTHPLGKKKPLNLLFNIGPYPCPSEAPAINKFKAYMGKHKYIVESIPSTRRIIDGNSPGDALTILPTGNSGNVLSPHYDDQVQMYLEGKYRTVVYTDSQIEKNSSATLLLLPQ